MENNITKTVQSIFAKNKKTGEIKKVNLLHVGKREFNCTEDVELEDIDFEQIWRTFNRIICVNRSNTKQEK
jgi:hypothetical protein